MALKSIWSTSRKSPDRNPYWPERRHWFVALAVGVAFIAILQWFASSTETDAEVRLSGTYRAISAQIVDQDHRILILNATGPRDARAVIGRLNQPWENRPATVIVGADRGNAEALWEAVQRLEPRQILVAGAPGDDAVWSLIERHARNHDIEISYLAEPVELGLDTLRLHIVPPGIQSGGSSSSYLEIERSEAQILISLGGLPTSGRYRLVASDRMPGPGLWTDLAVTAGEAPVAGGRLIALQPGERIDAALEPERIIISGRSARDVSER